jgi:hypothetical protein
MTGRTILIWISLTLLMLLSVNCFSQIRKPITKGNIILSGSGTIQFQKDKFSNGPNTSEVSSHFILFAPEAAFFIIDNLALGLSTSVYYNGALNNKYYTLGAGPIIRYYFNNGILLRADASYRFLYNISSSTDNQKYISVTPGAGYAFFLNTKISLEPCICYEFDNIDYNSTNNHKINSLRLELKFSIFL